MAIFKIKLGQPVAPLIFLKRDFGAKFYAPDAFLASISRDASLGKSRLHLSCVDNDDSWRGRASLLRRLTDANIPKYTVSRKM